MAFRAVTYRGRDAAADDEVLQVWRFEQLLTTNKEMGTAEVFRKYGVSSTYLP